MHSDELVDAGRIQGRVGRGRRPPSHADRRVVAYLRLTALVVGFVDESGTEDENNLVTRLVVKPEHVLQHALRFDVGQFDAQLFSKLSPNRVNCTLAVLD